VSVMTPVARVIPCAALPDYATSLDLNQGLRNTGFRPGCLPLKAVGLWVGMPDPFPRAVPDAFPIFY
jgi:hypothetical protein